MSKKAILENIRRNKAGIAPLPEIPSFLKENIDVIDAFSKNVEAGSGKVYLLENKAAISDLLEQAFPERKILVSPLEWFESDLDLAEIKDPHDLKKVDLTIINGNLGVAENGAVWVTEKDCGHRVLPFITQHLLVILNKKDIVQNMHVAYQKIEIDETGFGVFIAGPSKTADIEQSLVVGAQGARSFSVVLLEE